jgi:hypothetical protein
MIRDHIQPLMAEPYTHFLTVELTGNVKIRALTQALRVQTKVLFGKNARPCYSWFKTEDGVILSFGANRLLLEFINDYLYRCAHRYCETFEVLHKSHARVGFEKKLTKLYEQWVIGVPQSQRGSY